MDGREPAKCRGVARGLAAAAVVSLVAVPPHRAAAAAHVALFVVFTPAWARWTKYLALPAALPQRLRRIAAARAAGAPCGGGSSVTPGGGEDEGGSDSDSGEEDERQGGGRGWARGHKPGPLGRGGRRRRGGRLGRSAAYRGGGPAGTGRLGGVAPAEPRALAAPRGPGRQQAHPAPQREEGRPQGRGVPARHNGFFSLLGRLLQCTTRLRPLLLPPEGKVAAPR